MINIHSIDCIVTKHTSLLVVSLAYLITIMSTCLNIYHTPSIIIGFSFLYVCVYILVVYRLFTLVIIIATSGWSVKHPTHNVNESDGI